MHKNAYGKKQHHFWGKTTLIPRRGSVAVCGKRPFDGKGASTQAMPQ